MTSSWRYLLNRYDERQVGIQEMSCELEKAAATIKRYARVTQGLTLKNGAMLTTAALDADSPGGAAATTATRRP